MRPLFPVFLALLPLTVARVIEERHGGGHGDGHGGGHGGHHGHHDCCRNEVNDFVWTVHGFDYHASYLFSTPSHQNSFGYVNFNISNTVELYTAVCSATGLQLEEFFYGNMWYPCTLPSTAPAGAAVHFQFNRPTGQLDVNETWLCDEKGPKPPTTYHAAGATNLSLACTETYWQNPNWTYGTGQFWSDREIKCVPVDVTIKPYHNA